MRLMRTMREHILADTWLPYYNSQRDLLDARDSYGAAPTHQSRAARRRERMKRGRFEVIVRDDVGWVRDMTSGEAMHLRADPAEESRSLYVEQSRLIARLQAGPAQPLIVWDVGLGIAANAMSAILSVEGCICAPIARPLKLLSFENDLDSLELALDHVRWFRHLRHQAPRALLAENRWINHASTIEWLLLPGDFGARKFEAPAPDIIFFDPFSYKTDAALWTLAAFRELARVCFPKAVELFTYSSSTRVRAAMLAAGFYVAKGRSTGPKAETSIALSPLAASAPHDRELLGADWLAKWRRSDAQAPFGSLAQDASWYDAISEHPQFKAQ
jgi:queuine tRNA-ribosyltransferase